MNNSPIQVHTTVNGQDVSAGTLFTQANHATFRYSADYIAMAGSYDLAPSLPRSTAPFFFTGLGPFSDSAPDRWGRRLLARELKRTRLPEIEYLLGVNDLTRQGATRFFIGDDPVADGSGVPALADLPDLLNTADAVQENRDVADLALRRLYRATGSLGGARPKASVWDNNTLWMAKFPKPNGDDWDIIGWEAATLHIARMAGIDVPDHRTISIIDQEGRQRTILLTKRFDRVLPSPNLQSAQRIPYISALTALSATDGEGGDWLDLAEFVRAIGADTQELWRRAVFGAAIGNCDDHLRNHGFLRVSTGWRLSPAFDLNPEPFDPQTEDTHQLTLFGDSNISVHSLFGKDALALFGVRLVDANLWASTLASALAQAMPYVRMHHMDSYSVEIMATRFSHAHDAIPQRQ